MDNLEKVFKEFNSEVKPEQDEIDAILEGRRDRAINGTVSHEDIDWN